jgi:hypothetical protein
VSSDRTYTPEQAGAMLPELRGRLERIRSNRQAMLAAAERIKGNVAADGGGHFGSDYWKAARELRADIEQLASDNVVLRDPETGLIDFPGERDGRPIFLCWRLGEERVEHWHEIEAGFPGRRPL